MKSLVPTIGLVCLALAGCASQKTTYERGWVGGEYAVARPSKEKSAPESAAARSFPAALTPEYKGGILIDRARPESPIAQAGLREGDIILEVNSRKTPRLRDYRAQIDEAKPGESLTFKVAREGKAHEQEVAIGRERYRRVRTLTFGLSLKTVYTIDLLPDPEFSLIALGYKQNEERLDLRSAQTRLAHSTQTEAQSKEGWRVWLAPLSLGGHKMILAQEPAAASGAVAGAR